MSKRKFLYFLGIFLIFLITMTTLNTKAHTPSNMSLSNNSNTEILSVTITHSVIDPNSHFIESVEIKVNGSTALNQPYTSQPTSSSFTYQYDITAGDGATIQVIATCNIAGSITRTITIGDVSNRQNGDSSISGYLGIIFLIGISVALSLPIIYKKIRKVNK